MRNKLAILLGVLGVLLVFVGLTDVFTATNIIPSLNVENDLMLISVGLITLILFGYGIVSLNVDSIEEEEVGIKLASDPEFVEDSDDGKVMKLDPEKQKRNKKTLKKLLVEITEFKTSKNKEQVKDLVENGGWTEDRIAASYLSESINYPLLERLREWLEEDSETKERRLIRTVDEIEKAAERFERN